MTLQYTAGQLCM